MSLSPSSRLKKKKRSIANKEVEVIEDLGDEVHPTVTQFRENTELPQTLIGFPINVGSLDEDIGMAKTQSGFGMGSLQPPRHQNYNRKQSGQSNNKS